MNNPKLWELVSYADWMMFEDQDWHMSSEGRLFLKLIKLEKEKEKEKENKKNHSASNSPS